MMKLLAEPGVVFWPDSDSCPGSTWWKLVCPHEIWKENNFYSWLCVLAGCWFLHNYFNSNYFSLQRKVHCKIQLKEGWCRSESFSGTDNQFLLLVIIWLMGDILLFLQINTDQQGNFTSISPRLGGKLGKTLEIIHCTPSYIVTI